MHKDETECIVRVPFREPLAKNCANRTQAERKIFLDLVCDIFATNARDMAVRVRSFGRLVQSMQATSGKKSE